MSAHEFDVVDASISDFMFADSFSLAERFRGANARLIRVGYAVAPIVTLLLCAPLQRTWRRPPVGIIETGVGWQTAFASALETQDLYRREASASKLKSQSLPQGLFFEGLPRHEGNYPCEHADRYLCSWFHTFSVPAHFVEHATTCCRQWLQQLGEYCYIIADDAWTGSMAWQWASVDQVSSTNPDYWLFAEPWSAQNQHRWAGEGGITDRLSRLAVGVEQRGSAALALDPLGWYRLSLPSIGRRLFSRTSQNATKRLANPATQASQLVDLDRVFAMLARFVNVLDDPALFGSAEILLREEQRTLSAVPLSPGLPCDPFGELTAYLQRQEARYPVLTKIVTSPAQFAFMTNSSPI